MKQLSNGNSNGNVFPFTEDPIRTLDHLPVPPHAVLKMIIDVLLRAETASLLYTNDTRVLLDISLRRLADLPPGDQVRFVPV